MSLFEIHNKQMTAAQDRWADSLTFLGEAVPCVAVSLSDYELAAVGDNFTEAVGLTLQVQKSRFTGDLPQVEETIIYQARTYRILSILKTANGIAWRLVLGVKYAN